MIKRYSRKELTDIWSEENKYKIWLNVEVAAAEAMEKLNQIPKGVASTVKKKARIKVQVNYVRYTQPEGEYEKFVKFWVERVDSVNSCVTWDHEYKLSHGRIKKYDPEKRQIKNRVHATKYKCN